MNKNHGPAAAILVAFALFALLYGCSSAPTAEETATYSAPQLVQAAQAATDRGEYDLAMGYYQQILDRFGEDTEHVLWARYEIAFLYHKKGNDAEAIRLFEELIQSYGNPPDTNLPQGPRVLAEKVKGNLEASRPGRRPAREPSPQAAQPSPAPANQPDTPPASQP